VLHTPIERHGELWHKRDDTFEINGVRGGKVRTCHAIASALPRPPGLITAGSRHSPQVDIVAAMGHALGLPVRVHVPTGDTTPEIAAAEALGAAVMRWRPGHNSVIVSRARVDAQACGWRLVPFGMETFTAVAQTSQEVPLELPEGVRRIVVPVGSGMSLAGILHGMMVYRHPVPVLGVVVGANPEKRLNTYAPIFWRLKSVTLQRASVPYGKLVQATVGGVELDPVYEAKCAEFLQPGDLLWIVGKRTAQ